MCLLTLDSVPWVCTTPPIRASFSRSAEGLIGGSPHYDHTLPASSCLPSLLRSSCPTFSPHPTSHQRSFLSSHTRTHIPPSHSRLIDEATFDNGIRNWGVCLVIRYYQYCLITAGEDPRQADGFLCVQIWPSDNEALHQCALIYLAELIHPSQMPKFRELLPIL